MSSTWRGGEGSCLGHARIDSAARMGNGEHARVLVPPPLLYVAALAATLGLRALWPAPILDHPAHSWAGIGLLTAGLVFNAWGAVWLMRRRTPINPYKPTEALVTSGPFAISRNPLYVGLTVIFLGIVLLLDTFWGLAVLPPMLAMLHYGVVRREERYLERLFGDDYRRYRARVRRYL